MINSRLKALISSKLTTDRLSIGYEESSSASANDIDVKVKFCDTNISFLGGSNADTSSNYKLYSERGNSNNYLGLSRLSDIVYRNSIISEYDGTNRKRNNALIKTNIDFNTSITQTFTVNYGNLLVRDPKISDIKLNISIINGVYPIITKLYVSNINTVNKTISVTVVTASLEVGNGDVEINIG